MESKHLEKLKFKNLNWKYRKYDQLDSYFKKPERLKKSIFEFKIQNLKFKIWNSKTKKNSGEL